MPDAPSDGAHDMLDVIGTDTAPPSGRSRFRGPWVVLVAIALAVGGAVIVGRHAERRAAVPDEALLVTGSSYGFDVGEAGSVRIVFNVENLGHNPATIGHARVQAAGVSGVSTTGAGGIRPGQSATLTVSFRLRCSRDLDSQRTAATIAVPYRSAAGRWHEIRETPATPAAGPGHALAEVIETTCEVTTGPR